MEIQSVRGTYLYPLSEDRDVPVGGPAGITLIRIKSGEAYAVSSPGAAEDHHADGEDPQTRRLDRLSSQQRFCKDSRRCQE